MKYFLLLFACGVSLSQVGGCAITRPSSQQRYIDAVSSGDLTHKELAQMDIDFEQKKAVQTGFIEFLTGFAQGFGDGMNAQNRQFQNSSPSWYEIRESHRRDEELRLMRQQTDAIRRMSGDPLAPTW